MLAIVTIKNHFVFTVTALSMQCDQIGRFIALWATYQSLWQQLLLPKSPIFLGIFCKGVKIFHFSNEIIFGPLL